MPDQQVRPRHAARRQHLVQFDAEVADRARLADRRAALGQRHPFEVAQRSGAVVGADVVGPGPAPAAPADPAAFGSRSSACRLDPGIGGVVIARDQDDGRLAGLGRAVADQIELAAVVERDLAAGVRGEGRARQQGEDAGHEGSPHRSPLFPEAKHVSRAGPAVFSGAGGADLARLPLHFDWAEMTASPIPSSSSPPRASAAAFRSAPRC